MNNTPPAPRSAASGTTASRADLILHPIRMRIVMALSGGRRMTTQQIANLLPGEARATLYRHIHRLLAGAIIEIVATHPIRGTVEKVYALAQGADAIPPADWEALGRAGHQQSFAVYIAEILATFQQYAERSPDFDADAVRYRVDAAYMNDAEFAAFIAARDALFATVMHTPPTPDRRRRMVAVIAVPFLDDDAPADDPYI